MGIANHVTIIEVFQDFMEQIFMEIEVDGFHRLGYNRNDDQVLWANLNSHILYLVTQIVEIRNGPTTFIGIPWPLYQPKYGPIEYTICDLVGHLTIDAQAHWTTTFLERKVTKVNATINGFWNTFNHCGYPINH